MKYLLIDDFALRGWKNILEKAIIRENNSIETALTFEDAIVKIQKKWSFIFLDMRLNEADHSKLNSEDYSGFKILKKLREDFSSVNFATPVILITASNKIWNINRLLENGIDAFYIKEHPDFFIDEESSRKNLEYLQEAFKDLTLKADKRHLVWELSNQILKKIQNHIYFNGDKRCINSKQRIFDKIKLGYAYLFKQQTQLETRVLNVNNEALAFIIFWSILEELVKSLTEPDTWDLRGDFSGSWKFKNDEFFIEKMRGGSITINISKEAGKSRYLKNKKNLSESDSGYDSYAKGHIKLSEQVYSILAAFTEEKSSFTNLAQEFKEINKFRNEVDFIHSRVHNIFHQPLITEKSKLKHFEYIQRTLVFINNILSLI